MYIYDKQKTAAEADKEKACMPMYLIIDNEVLLGIEAGLCIKLLQYVALFHGNREGNTPWLWTELPSFSDDCAPLSVQTKENFEGSRVFDKTANRNLT